MDVWIIQDGEKVGPLRDYDVRGKILSGELTGDVPAWHEGQADWQPLHRLPIFEREFEMLDENPIPRREPEPEPKPESTASPPPLPANAAQPHLVRRFWARWFDLYLYAGLWWLALWAAGRDIGGTLNNPWLTLFQYVPWFVIEAFLIHRFGTTPGKWLLGIHVRNDDGSPLTLPQATRRSMRVLFIGIGFGWGILALLCQIMAFFTTRKIGKPLWDAAGGHHLETKPISPLRVASYVIGLFAALQMQMVVVGPFVTEQMKKTFPALREQIEKNPPWHLPDNRTRPSSSD